MGTDTCVVLRGGNRNGEYGKSVGKQGVLLAEGVSAQSAGSYGICMHRLRMPPRTRAIPHIHAGHESAIFILTGSIEVWFGEGLTDHFVLTEGDYVYIPPNVPHLPVNTSDTEMVALVARTDPNEQESVELISLPETLAHKLSGVKVVGAQ
jgi:uncharacterized RmlC-like cupin family protein